MELTKKDQEKLRFVLEKIKANTACSFDKQQSLEYLESVMDPKCAVCRKPLGEEMVLVNERKFHGSCVGKYRVMKEKISDE